MTKQKYSKLELVNHLKEIGISEGDTVLVRASLGRVGRMEKSNKNTFIDALIEAVGVEGTIVSLGFTKSFFMGVGAKKSGYVFSQNTPPNIGALSKIFNEHPDSVRSGHPTNSYIAIGKNAEKIVSDHNEHSLSYTPIERLIQLNGKMILIGCIKDSPGFTTVHYAQEKLGLTKQSLLTNTQRVYFEKEGKKKLFIRKDSGGCSAGFRNFYADYVENNSLSTGMVGDAPSILINAKDAFDIEFKKLKQNKKYFLCDNNLCFSCRATWIFNLSDLPKYLILKIISRMRSIGLSN